MKFAIILLIVCVLSQEYEGPTVGVCIDTIGGKTVSPPNYSKNAVGVNACKAKCNQDTLCVGFSHAEDLGGAAKNRCAIWIDRTVLTTRGNDYQEWEVHNYPGWVENVLEIDSGDSADKWECYVRIDTCPAGTATRNGVTVSYPEIDQGRYVDKQCSEGDSMTNGMIRIECQNGQPVVSGSCIRDCSPGSLIAGGLTMTYSRIGHATTTTLNCADFDPTYEGTVQVRCNNGTASKVGDGTCAQKVIPEWTDMGKGVCRDTTVSGPYTRSVGPGVSPPNFSREGYTLEECKAECEKDALICAGMSHGGVSKARCALFLNVDIADCGKKPDWTAYPYDYGWTVGQSVIDGASGEALWQCEKRKLPEMLTMNFELLDGHGVCANAQNLSPPNYSKSGITQGGCLAECSARKDCLAFAHAQGNRCALYMKVKITTPETVTVPEATGLGGWEQHNGELGWKNNPVISQSDESGGQFLCYKKLARRKKLE